MCGGSWTDCDERTDSISSSTARSCPRWSAAPCALGEPSSPSPACAVAEGGVSCIWRASTLSATALAAAASASSAARRARIRSDVRGPCSPTAARGSPSPPSACTSACGDACGDATCMMASNAERAARRNLDGVGSGGSSPTGPADLVAGIRHSPPAHFRSWPRSRRTLVRSREGKLRSGKLAPRQNSGAQLCCGLHAMTLSTEDEETSSMPALAQLGLPLSIKHNSQLNSNTSLCGHTRLGIKPTPSVASSTAPASQTPSRANPPHNTTLHSRRVGCGTNPLRPSTIHTVPQAH